MYSVQLWKKHTEPDEYPSTLCWMITFGRLLGQFISLTDSDRSSVFFWKVLRAHQHSTAIKKQKDEQKTMNMYQETSKINPFIHLLLYHHLVCTLYYKLLTQTNIARAKACHKHKLYNFCSKIKHRREGKKKKRKKVQQIIKKFL